MHVNFDYNDGLAMLYGVLFLFELIQLGRIIYYRHKFQSFTVAFLSLCFFWALLRVLFFSYIVEADWDSTNNWIFSFIYWIPINIQFATFSLLVAYYAHLQHKQKGEWRIFKKKYTIIYATFNLVFFCLECVLIILGIKFDHGPKEPNWLTDFHKIFSSLVFILLMSINGFYGWEAAKLVSHKGSAVQTKLLARLSFKRITVVSFSLFTIFTVRGVYDFITVVSHDMDVTLGKEQEYLPFILFVVFEIIPTILVLILFGHVRSTSLGALSKKTYGSSRTNYESKTTPGARVSAGQLVRAEIFNDPRRYDSDDETTPLRGSDSANNATTPNSESYNTNAQYYSGEIPQPSGINVSP